MNVRNSLSALTISLLATASVWAQAPATGTKGSTPPAGQRPEAGSATSPATAGSGSMGSTTNDGTGSMKSGKAAKTMPKSVSPSHQGQEPASGSMGGHMKNDSMKSSTKPMNSTGTMKPDGTKPATGSDMPATKQ